MCRTEEEDELWAQADLKNNADKQSGKLLQAQLEKVEKEQRRLENIWPEVLTHEPIF